ncbi:serine hydrolase [Streptacidiphilus pinicola]|uniref:Serine hydrolase n=1 Tax=Streptacidiphilus pinicola TaxID=2219663 RepID=A0A2X0IK59_9ACTN|nr:serine hydrolase domain-containing protein [Streptacidiphilus pinicola]RAG85037.1 serine hydrolase [Streptacidiphilus pinicola]
MSQDKLSDVVQATAAKFGIPGVAVGIWADGQEIFAAHGMTSLDNPLPVDQHTLFQIGSITKSFTATALMRLVADGRVELEAPVRRYVPELELADEQAATEITVLNLLNHTAGLEWNLLVDTGDGDDALAQFVAKFPELRQIAPPGTRSSYSQAGYNLVGRILEKVTGLTYEQAVSALVLEPAGLSNSFFAPEDVRARRFAEGHNRAEDGTLSVAQEWQVPRCQNPGGGLNSTVSDLLRWAQVHLADGRTPSGAQVLPAEAVRHMRVPTVALQASSLGDALGICWFLRDVDGVHTFGHGGSANGQFAEFLIVPDRNFAIVVTSNAGPDGTTCNQAIVRWALENYLGILDRDPEPIPYDAARAQEIVGGYDIDVMTLTIATDGNGLTLAAAIKPEIRAASTDEMPADYEPAAMGLLPGDGDEYIITEGGLTGQRGFFSRDENGAVVAIDLAGRVFNRVPAASE